MELAQYLEDLARANRHGWAFLAAYGLSWLGCAGFWARASPRTAAYATLFQGLVALPVALGLTALGPPRPSHPVLDDLTVVLATGQLLGLPVVVYLVLSRRYELVPLAMVVLLVVHFAPYSWLYQTPLYFVLGAAIAVSSVVAMTHSETAGPLRTCVSTGVLMLVGAVIAALL